MRWIKQRRMSVQLYHQFFVYTCGWGGGLRLIPAVAQAFPWQPDCQTARRKHTKSWKRHTHTHVRTHCRGVVRTLVDIIRPDTFLSRFQIRRVCILLNADSVSLFLFPPTQPRSLYLFVLLTCLIPETPWLIRAVQTTLCPGAGGNKDQPKKKKKKEKRERERKRERKRRCKYKIVP